MMRIAKPYPPKPAAGIVEQVLSFEQYSCQTVYKDTGFTDEQLVGWYNKNQPHLPKTKRRPYYFFGLYLAIHRGMPTRNQWDGMMVAALGTLSYTTYARNCIPIAEAIAAHDKTIEENFANRFAYDNHCAEFPERVTGIVDGFPIFVSQPSHNGTFKALNSGKKKATLTNAELIVDLKGNIISFAYPFLGVRNDAAIRAVVAAKTPLLPGERLLGDRIYKGSPNVLTGYVATKDNPLSTRQRSFNYTFNGPRQRVSYSRKQNYFTF